MAQIRELSVPFGETKLLAIEEYLTAFLLAYTNDWMFPKVEAEITGGRMCAGPLEECPSFREEG
jgi:hypothetical protein